MAAIGATTERILRGLLHEAENAGDTSPRVRAWETLAKHLGLLSEHFEFAARVVYQLDLGGGLTTSAVLLSPPRRVSARRVAARPRD